MTFNSKNNGQNADNIAINIDANIATDEHIMRRIATINGEANGLQHSKSNGQNGDNIAINIATDEHIMRRIATYIAVSAAALSAGSVFGWGAFSQWSFVLSICLAIFLAVPTIAWIISKFGLHPAMCTTIVSLDFGWILAIFAYDLPMLIAAGLFLGYSLGGIVVIFPLHIAEIADNKRKRMTSNVFQLSLAIGIAFGYLGGYWKENVLIGICGLFLISYGLAIPSIPSLPESVTTSISISSMLRRGITKEVMKGAGLVILTQLSGINLFIFHAGYIFNAVHINGHWAVTISATGLLVGTCVASAIAYKWGRRGLHMTSSIIMAFTNFLLSMYFNVFNQNSEHSKNDYGWMVVTLIWFCMVAFTFGYGISPWLMFNESVPSEIKVMCVSINWLVSFVVIMSFPYVVGAVGIGWALFPLSVFSIMSAVYVGCVH